MIPLAWFFVAWLVLFAIFTLMTLLTLAMTLRYGLSCFSTYLITGLFVAVIVIVLAITGSYLLGVDWTQSFSFFSDSSSFFPN